MKDILNLFNIETKPVDLTYCISKVEIKDVSMNQILYNI